MGQLGTAGEIAHCCCLCCIGILEVILIFIERICLLENGVNLSALGAEVVDNVFFPAH